MKNIQELSPWLAVAQKRMREFPVGAFVVEDKTKKTILIEWTIGLLVSNEIAEIKKKLVDLGCPQIVAAECEFLKKNPQAVLTDGFLKVCAPLLEKGIDSVDWKACKAALDGSLRTIYTADIKSFGEEIVKKIENDVIIFVTAKDVATDDLLGFVSGSVTPGSALGDLKIITCVVDEKHHGQDIERLLIGGLLKALPSTLRLFTGVRPTNKRMINICEAIGFEQIAAIEFDKNHRIDISSWRLFSYDVMLKGYIL
jgi:hypothetical protein